MSAPDPATCSHKFVDSNCCLKCGWTPPVPQPGEIWLHHAHGPLRIVRAWSAKESVCEPIDPSDQRRLVCLNDLMRKLDATDADGSPTNNPRRPTDEE